MEGQRKGKEGRWKGKEGQRLITAAPCPAVSGSSSASSSTGGRRRPTSPAGSGAASGDVVASAAGALTAAVPLLLAVLCGRLALTVPHRLIAAGEKETLGLPARSADSTFRTEPGFASSFVGVVTCTCDQHRVEAVQRKSEERRRDARRRGGRRRRK